MILDPVIVFRENHDFRSTSAEITKIRKKSHLKKIARAQRNKDTEEAVLPRAVWVVDLRAVRAPPPPSSLLHMHRYTMLIFIYMHI